MQKLTAYIALTCTLLLMPMPGIMAESISADDTVAGFGSQVTVSGLSADETLSLHLLGPDGTESTLGSASGTAGTTIAIPANSIPTPGMYRVIALRNSAIVASSTFEVVANRVDENQSTVVASRTSMTADGADTVVVTVTVRDTEGNPLSGRLVQLIGSRAGDRITPLTGTRETDSQGTMQFGIQTGTPGDIVLRAMDMLTGTVLSGVAQISAQSANKPSPLGGQLTQTAAAAPAKTYDVLSGFEVTPKETAVKVGDALSLVTIRAVDANGNTVENFTGKVIIQTPDDPSSSLPGLFEDSTTEAVSAKDRQGSLTFTGKNRGVFPIAWTVSFSTPGPQKIIVSDESGVARGEATVNVTGNAAIPDNRRIKIVSPKQGDVIGGASVTVEGTGPALHNLRLWADNASVDPAAITKDPPVATGETDANGKFSMDVALPAGAADVVMQMQDESGLYDSGVVRFKVDTTGPKLDLTIDPRAPTEGESVTFTVVSEPGIKDMTLHVEDRDVTLTETTPGTYTVMIPTPARSAPGFTLSATDAAGNVSTAEGVLSISGPQLPQVQNLKAEAVAGGVNLTWDPVPDDKINAYRIEVGKTAERADLTLDTTDASGAGSVMGLTAGTDYFFAVRAISGGDVGPRSAVVSSRTLGMEVTVTPQDSGLMLQWTFPDATPLQSFELAYGFAADQLNEKVTLDSDMRIYTLHDLLPQTYVLKVTPIAVNGQRMDDLAVMTSGTPLSGAFHPSAGIDTPFNNTDSTAPSNQLHESSPEVTHVGLPTVAFWTVVLAASAGVIALVRRRQRKTMALQDFLVNASRRYDNR